MLRANFSCDLSGLIIAAARKTVKQKLIFSATPSATVTSGGATMTPSATAAP
ncbi:hypothetical protein GW781_01450 [bacterium]|nr:hypothetical protein [bacterium]NCT19801.1 hypothetical protein [bacterium]